MPSISNDSYSFHNFLQDLIWERCPNSCWLTFSSGITVRFTDEGLSHIGSTNRLGLSSVSWSYSRLLDFYLSSSPNLDRLALQCESSNFRLSLRFR